MPECESCGAHVTASFRRVFAEPETGQVYGCPNCLTMGEISDGEASR